LREGREGAGKRRGREMVGMGGCEGCTIEGGLVFSVLVRGCGRERERIFKVFVAAGFKNSLELVKIC
jgi:hypothetical protein